MLEIKPKVGGNAERFWSLLESSNGQFWGLMRQSILISGSLAILLVATACNMWLKGLTVPNELYLLLGTVIGFFFGGKVEGRLIARKS